MNITNAIPGNAEVHQNELLSVLLTGISDRIASHLTLVDLPVGEVLHQTEHAEAYAYFPNDALVSLLSVIENGKSAEIGVVGSEGLVGIEGMIGGRNPYIQAKVQCPGTAFRVPNQLLRHEFNRLVEMRGLILHYMQSMISQIGQAAICYRHHSIEQQLCRKLLVSSDRLGSDDIALTQSTIADLLGVRREGVTAAAGELRRLGIIDYRRGHIRILERARLEERSCECWAVLQTQRHQFRPNVSRAGTLDRRPSLGPVRPARLPVARHDTLGNAAA
jgi:CRP-like cAMP-binding protein